MPHVVVVSVVVTAFVLLYAFTALRGGIRVKLVLAPLWLIQQRQTRRAEAATAKSAAAAGTAQPLA